LNAGEEIALINGPDEICQPMLEEPGCHCHNQSVRDRDRQALMDIGRSLGKHIEPGNVLILTKIDIDLLRNEFARGALRHACNGCEWYDMCTEIAKNRFRGCRLRLPLH
jgi:hypothetical protein